MDTNNYQSNLFDEIFEAETIENIKKFSRIARAENLPVELGFSGGKDSIVSYDLCKKAGIEFTPIFNYAFEPPEVVKFIRENYPDVVIRRREKSYFQLIKEHDFLPTKNLRFCCKYFKEYSKKSALITGVRRAESAGRRKRKLFETKKANIRKYTEIFSENCTETGKSPILLRPILNYSTQEVWDYIRKYNLPYPSLYDEGQSRCGCMLCPLATIKSNLFWIKKYPNLLSSFNRNVLQKIQTDFIYNRRKDMEECLSNDPYRYLLYWLSYSFRPSKKNKLLIDKFLKENPEND
jgi:phosphoadenosine phosphosulfate reductase